MKFSGVMVVLLAGCGSGAAGLPAGIDRSAMDPGADPCSDFYRYSCGGWLTSHPIGPNGSLLARLTDAFFATERDERSLLADMMAGAQTDPDAVLLRAYDGACLQAAASAGRAPLDGLLQQIDAAQSGAALAPAVAALHDAGASALFGFAGTRDLMQPVNVIAAVSEGGVGLPGRSYYLDASSAPVVAAYRTHITMLSGLLGVNDAAMPDAVVRVETALATAMLTPDQHRDPMQTYHIEPLATLTAAVPDFDFAGYFAAEHAPVFTSLDVAEPAFFDALEQLLTQTSLDDLKRYLRWRALEAFAGKLDDGVVAEEYRFHAGTFQGFTQPLPRDEYCLRSTVSALGWSVSRLYALRRGADAQPAAEQIVARVRQALDGDLSTVAWLDDATRAAAIAKLDAVRTAVFAPGDFSPYVPGVRSLPPSFAGAAAALSQDARARDLARIGGQDTREWFLSPITVNAAYSPTLNAVNVPAAILQPPMFDLGFPDVVSFGAIGTVIGHELTHGFDDQGRKFDAGGALTDWWTPSVKTQFDARAQCLVDQYGAIAAAPGVNIDGQLTLGENIADVAGVKLAYAALAPDDTRWAEFSDKQVFFIAYAQAWCTNIRPESAATLARTDPHSPASARVNAVLADTPEFRAAFQCPAGAPLAPATPCAVW